MSSAIRRRPRLSSPARRAAGTATGGEEANCATGCGLRDSWRAAFVCGLLVLAVWLVFGQTRHFDFVNFDDALYVYENPVVTSGLGVEGVWRAFTHFDGEEWWPLTAVSHMLDWELYGAKAGGHHLTNVMLHALTAVLLFLVLREMTGALGPSAFVAAVFAVHPLRVESVAWVTERKDVLSGVFFMLTLWAYVRYVQESRDRRARSKIAYGLSLLFFTLGLLAKSMVVTLPFVLLLLDYWPLRRMTWSGDHAPTGVRTAGRLVAEKIPFLLLAAASSVVTVLAIQDVGAGAALGWPWRVGNALVAYVVYLRQMFVPVGLAALYPHPLDKLPVWEIGVAAGVLLAVTGLALAGWRQRPYLAVGWLWYAGMLGPVIGMLQVGSQAHADRYTYLPQIGLYLMVAWGAMDLSRRWRQGRILWLALAGAALVLLMITAHAQTRHWRDSVSLWTHTLACTSGNFSAHYNLGMELAAQNRRHEAIEQFERALQLRPDSAKAHNNLGIALAGDGNLDEAIAHWRAALRHDPNNAEVNNNLANALAAQRKWDEAIEQYRTAIRGNPADAKFHYNLGVALAAQQRWDEAIAEYRRALGLRPDLAEVHNNLGIALAAQGAMPEAIQYYKRALQLKPDFAGAHNNLGVALAAQGDRRDALSHFQEALRLATAQGNRPLAEAIRARMDAGESAAPSSGREGPRR
jgi:tetratricopeptide (TPR) repeat protein